MKIKEKVLKEVVDKVIHLKSRNEIIPKVIDLTLAEVVKVIDDEIVLINSKGEWINKKELKQKLGGKKG